MLARSRGGVRLGIQTEDNGTVSKQHAFMHSDCLDSEILTYGIRFGVVPGPAVTLTLVDSGWILASLRVRNPIFYPMLCPRKATKIQPDVQPGLNFGFFTRT